MEEDRRCDWFRMSHKGYRSFTKMSAKSLNATNTGCLRQQLRSLYAIPKINILCNLCCLKTRLRLLCNKFQQHSSLNLVSQQLKLCNIFIFGMAYSYSGWKRFSRWCITENFSLKVFNFLVLIFGVLLYNISVPTIEMTERRP